MPERQMHQIGRVADRVGLSLRTVRYYGEVGLVEPSGRTEGGFRLYTDEDVARLELIKQMKPLEFSLEELRDLLEVRDRLARDDLDEEIRRELTERLSGYVHIARQRCKGLREQLAAVDSVTGRLERETRAQRRRPASRR